MLPNIDLRSNLGDGHPEWHKGTPSRGDVLFFVLLFWVSFGILLFSVRLFFIGWDGSIMSYMIYSWILATIGGTGVILSFMFGARYNR